MNSRRRMCPREAQDRTSYRAKRADWKGSGARTADVRFGLKADISRPNCDVGFTLKRTFGSQIEMPVMGGHLHWWGYPVFADSNPVGL
jgi:hypothetical protein